MAELTKLVVEPDANELGRAGGAEGRGEFSSSRNEKGLLALCTRVPAKYNH